MDIMDIESEIVREYKEYMYDNSIFGDILEEKKTILPDTPQSFSKFPTIVIKEVNSTNYSRGKTLDRTEFIDNLVYQVEVYTKDVTTKINGVTKTYAARTVINELKDKTFDFFNQIGFNRITATRGEYIDINVNRYIMVFDAKLNNWNMKIL